MKRTKIVCTIGPASDAPATLEAMIRSGMNVARLNFSHGTHAGHAKLARAVRAAAKKRGEPVAILGDLQGPKIRLGVLPEKGVELKNGETITLPVTYAGLFRDLKKGDRIYIDDGIVEVAFAKGAAGQITVKVVSGGTVTSHKGMNFPDSTLRVSSLTTKDREDVAFGVKIGVDWMALSFVTSAKDVVELRRLIRGARKAEGAKVRRFEEPKIIVKIEKHEALERFDEILAAADAVMIARGDLGVETEAAGVPIRQKEIVEKCRRAGKPVVVATQMLDSMTRNPRPTRAEVSDVANAVCDHADAVMLSGESATGKYPRQTVAMMARIIEETEASPFDDTRDAVRWPVDAIVASAQFAPWSVTAMSSRPELPFFLACPTATQTRQANIRWGVRPFTLAAKTTAQFVTKALAELKRRKWIRKGMRVAMLIGGEHGEGYDVVTVK